MPIAGLLALSVFLVAAYTIYGRTQVSRARKTTRTVDYATPMR
jgi:hypothetical protein